MKIKFIEALSRVFFAAGAYSSSWVRSTTIGGSHGNSHMIMVGARGAWCRHDNSHSAWPQLGGGACCGRGNSHIVWP
jgi:hypothetical protein